VVIRVPLIRDNPRPVILNNPRDPRPVEA